MSKYCKYCGKLLVQREKELPGNFATRLYCDRSCVGALSHKRQVDKYLANPKLCNVCNKPIPINGRSISEVRRTRHCSKECFYIYQNHQEKDGQCNYCGKILNNKNPRFCSRECNKLFMKDRRETYICKVCGKSYVGFNEYRKCSECRREVVYEKTEVFSILDLSKRTMQKIFHRANNGCSLCGWNEDVCDVHHIIPIAKGGNNEHENLIYICPNCHRVAGKNVNKLGGIEKLKSLCLANTFPDFMEYYCPNKKAKKKQKKSRRKDRSHEEAMKTRRKFDPTKEALQSLIDQYPMTTIAKMFGITSNSVKKRAIKLGIEIPKRLGFWAKLKADKIQKHKPLFEN